MSYGYWGESSFDDARWENACRVVRKNLSIVVMRVSGEQDMLIWPVRRGKPTTIMDFVIHTEWTTAASQANGERIVESVRLK